MKIVITPTYKNLFDGEKPDLKELLFDISSKASIALLCSINAKLFISKESHSQFEIFASLTKNLNVEERNKLLRKLAHIQVKDLNQEIQLFSIQASLELIHYELVNFRKVKFEKKNFTPEQELRFLKAYFVTVQNINEKYHSVFGSSLEKGEFFHTAMWPTFIEQLELNNSLNPFVALIRALIFFNYFESNLDYQNYLEKFVRFHQKRNYWEYSKVLMDLLRINWEGKTKDSRYGNFLLRTSPDIKRILENFSLNLETYKINYKNDKKGFVGLKEDPIIPFEEDNYLITNWNFIINKVYEGLIFDFYHNSGIKEKVFKRFPDYKNFVAQEITEKYLLQSVLKHYLDKKHSVLRFDKSNDKGFPDAYYRKGKYVFLFEIKDAFFPSAAINSYDYEEICKAIDLKYNSKSKGTGQLIKQLKILKDKPFEERSYNDLKLKTRNLVIFPIMIYTDNFFSMPGINRYLNLQFQEKIKDQELDLNFQKIENLTFINISFFLNQIHHIKNFDLRECLEAYISKIKNSEKRHNRFYYEKDMQEMNKNFEEILSDSEILERKDDDFVRTIFKIFRMKENFA